MTLSVILSTDDQPRGLEMVPWGYTVQTLKDFELVIADDGSGPGTATVIDRFARSGELRLADVRHEDAAFWNTGILNRGFHESSGDYPMRSRDGGTKRARRDRGTRRRRAGGMSHGFAVTVATSTQGHDPSRSRGAGSPASRATASLSTAHA